MSVSSYRDAAARLRAALDLLGRYRGPCGLCGHPDARHRQADAIVEGLLAGDDVEEVADDYLSSDLGVLFRAELAYQVAFATLAADPRLHGLTRGRAAGIDREVWADLAAPPDAP